MIRVYAIASGKGGTGKTTVTANLGPMLARHGRRTCILDADTGMANLALILGLENLPVTLHEVLAGKASIQDAIYDGPLGVKIIPSGLSLQGFQSANPDRLKEVLQDLVDDFDIMLLDAPAGISKDGVIPLAVADEVLLIVNPEISSIVDAIKTRTLTEMIGGHVAGAIMNRVTTNNGEMSRAQMQNLLGVRVIGFIPEDPYVRRSSAARMPVVLKYPSSDASQAFSRISAGLAGIEYQAEEAVANASREGFVDRLARVLFRGKT